MFIWNLDTNERHKDTIFDEWWCGVTSIDFDPQNPKQVALGMRTSIVNVVDFEKPKDLLVDELHKARVYNVLFTPDGKRLISSGEDWHIVIRSVG